MRGKGRRWSGHDSGKWGRCLSSAAAGRPCDRLGTLGRARWRGEDAARGARGPDWREFAGTFGWPDGGRLPPPSSGREWQGAQSGQGTIELGFPRPALWQMQGEAACRAGEPSGQGEEPSPKGLGGRDLLAQTDPRRPAGQVWAITCTASQAPLAAKRPDGMWFRPTPYLRSRMAFSISAWRRWSASSSRVSPSRSVMKP